MKGKGLGRLSPRIRLILTIVLTTLFVWIQTPAQGIVAMVLGTLLVVLNPRNTYRLSFTIIGTSLAWYFVGDALLPSSVGANITPIGSGRDLSFALVGATKRGATLAVSLAWLGSSTLPDIYTSLAFRNRSNRWLMLFLRSIQIMKRQVTVLRQSFAVRCPPRRWYDVRQQLLLARLILQAVIYRLFDGVASITFSSESHHASRRSSDFLALTIHNLSVRYSAADGLVLKNLSISASQGETILITGRSKAGKTTLLRTIAGYIPRIKGEYSGSIEVAGLDLVDLSLNEIADHVRFVPSDPSMSIIGLTVGQDIILTSPNEAAARAALAKMKIDHLWHRETTDLSGGEQARLVLAGLLASNARVILLDCPLQQLDAEGRIDFIEALDVLRLESRFIIVIVEPAQDEIGKRITRYIELETGIIKTDRPEGEGSFVPRVQLDGLSLSLETNTEADSSKDELVVAEFCDVSLHVDDRVLLSAVSFRLYKGECVVVVGPNGSGKTTAFLALAGLYKPAKGVIRRLAPIGVMFQNPSLQMIGLTTRYEIELKPRLLGMSSDVAADIGTRQLEWIGLTGLEWPGDIHPDETRFLAISAMIAETRIFVLDEPTIGLDDYGVAKIGQVVSAMVREGKTVVVITHDARLFRFAHRVFQFSHRSLSVTNGSP